MPRKKKPDKKPKVVVPEGGWPTGKKPKIPSSVGEVTKRTTVHDWKDPTFNKRRLVWRFSEIDLTWKHLENELNNRDILHIVNKLQSFESMQMGELLQPGSEHVKKYEIDSMPAAAKARLIELQKDDEDHVVRLRFSNKGRLYGVMREHVFHVLWWDPRHKVWPSQK